MRLKTYKYPRFSNFDSEAQLSATFETREKSSFLLSVKGITIGYNSFGRKRLCSPSEV